MTPGDDLPSKNKSPLYDQVYGSIRDLIMSGSLRPGESISEVKLSERLSVSRTPVREAVRRLVAENLMEAPARGLLRVYAPTVSDIAEVYFTRAVLEGAAAGLAAHYADAPFLEKLESLTGQMASAVKKGRPQDTASINGDFHLTIIEASRNRRLIDTLAELAPVTVRYRRLSMMFPDHLKRSLIEHRQIVRLFRDGTSTEVEGAFRGHILRSGGRVVAAVIQLEGYDEPTELGAASYLLDMCRRAATDTTSSQDKI